MLINKGTVRILLSFYESNSAELEIIAAGDIYNVRVWDKIFIWFFSEEPVDSKKIPPHHKKGSSDIRWDDILHARQGLAAQDFVAKLIARKNKYPKHTQKAA